MYARRHIRLTKIHRKRQHGICISIVSFTSPDHVLLILNILRLFVITLSPIILMLVIQLWSLFTICNNKEKILISALYYKSPTNNFDRSIQMSCYVLKQGVYSLRAGVAKPDLNRFLHQETETISFNNCEVISNSHN